MATSTDPPFIAGVSRVLPDGTIVELLFDREAGSTAFAVRSPGGSITIEREIVLPDGRRLRPYAATNNLLTSGCVRLPSAVDPFGDKATLVSDLRAFLRRHVQLSPLFEDIAPYYVLLSWVYDGFNELPMLRFRGDYGTGKTRALLTVGSVCYKAFFASGASTVSPLFHILDVFRGTLVLDEADFRFSDATADLTKILNNGTVAGVPVLRTLTNADRELNPRAFSVYGPKLIAMRRSFRDDALESRFLTEETGRHPLRPDLPIHAPPSLARDAQSLRNRLLSWRFAALDTVAPDPARALVGVEPRLNQTALALLSLIDEPEALDRVRSALMTDARPESASVDSEALLIRVMTSLFDQAPALGVAVRDATRAFNAEASALLGRPMSDRWVGGMLRDRLGLTTRKTGGVYRVSRDQWPRLKALAVRIAPAVSPP